MSKYRNLTDRSDSARTSDDQDFLSNIYIELGIWLHLIFEILFFPLSTIVLSSFT